MSPEKRNERIIIKGMKRKADNIGNEQTIHIESVKQLRKLGKTLTVKGLKD